MPVPRITHLQFLILDVLLQGERSGTFIRDTLVEQGQRQSRRAFYDLMARLEDARFVKGWYDKKNPEGFTLPPRHYKVMGEGKSAWQEACQFYLEHMNANRKFVKILPGLQPLHIVARVRG